MKIEELDECEDGADDGVSGRQIVIVRSVDAKRAIVGAGARILFYPTLLYNVLRNKIESEFRWWDQVDQFLLLGAVPFPKDVPRLKQLGVGGVITLNEPYETLVPTSLYLAHEIDHLVIPTRDYLFAPSFVDISQAVDFIHQNASSGRTTYVHCKAGRGRSTTIVLCYLVRYKHMTPIDALEYVRSRRPRVLLAPSQWKAVQEYCKCESSTIACSPSGDAVLITKADLEGYHGNYDGDTELMVWSKGVIFTAHVDNGKAAKIEQVVADRNSYSFSKKKKKSFSKKETPIKSLGTIIGISTCRLVPNFQHCQFGRLWSLVTTCFSMPWGLGPVAGYLQRKKKGSFTVYEGLSV